MYNLQNYIAKLEDLKEWQFPFERFKHIQKKEETKEEPKVEELNDDNNDLLKKLTTPAKTVNLDDIKEGHEEISTSDRKLLHGF
jgi:hypothetical protein